MPMRPALTPAFLRSVKPPASGQVEYPDGACPGLRLRLSQGGTATWILGCRDAAAKTRRFTLGAYPGLGLANAREKARQLREEVRQGADPIRKARQTKAAAARPPPAVATLTALLDGYARDVGAGRRSWDEARRRIEDVFRLHLEQRSTEITAPELQLTVDAHASRSSAGAAVRYIRPVLKWGAKRGLVVRGTGEVLDQPDGAQSIRQRRLSREEMGAISRVLSAAGGYGQALRWLFLTGCRLNEACGAGRISTCAPASGQSPSQNRGNRWPCRCPDRAWRCCVKFCRWMLPGTHPTPPPWFSSVPAVGNWATGIGQRNASTRPAEPVTGIGMTSAAAWHRSWAT